MVTRSTRGVESQRESSSWRRRATVDLPTATEPAMPMTKGVEWACGFAQERVALGGGAAAPVDVELEKGRQGPVNHVDLGHVDGVA